MKTFYNQDNIIVRRSNKQDVDYLKDNLRQRDVDEVWASHNFTPKEALNQCLESIFCLTVQNGTPIAMFGINPQSILGNTALIWFLSSDDIDNINIRFAKNSRKFVDLMLEFYPYLYNYVDLRNKKSIKWLQFLNAKIEEPRPYGIEGKEFLKFSFKR